MEDNRRKREKTDFDKCLINTYTRDTEVKKREGERNRVSKMAKIYTRP